MSREGVVQESLVGTGGDAELLVEVHVEVDRLGRRLSRLLEQEPDAGAGVGSDPELHMVVVPHRPDAVGQHDRRRFPEPHVHLGGRDGQALAGSHEERHAGPPPVVDLQTEGHEGLRLGLRVDALDRAVAVVLTAHVLGRVRSGHRAEDVDATVGDRVAAARGRLHRDEREDLEEVVLHGVTEGTDAIVEAAPILDAEGLRHRDLDRLDVVAVPERFEDLVREPQVHDVLDRLLAQEVIDPVDLVLGQHLQQLAVECLRGREVVAERLLDHDPRTVGELLFGEPSHDGAEQVGWDLQVEQRMVGGADRLMQPVDRVGIVQIAGHVPQPPQEPVERVGVDDADAVLDRRACRLP